MGIRFSFAATRADLMAAFARVRDGNRLAFFKMGTYDHPNVEPLKLEDLPDLGSAKTGILVLETAFFVVLENEEITMQTIPLGSGGLKFTIDPYGSPGAFVFRPGGLFQNRFFIPGEISSLYPSGGAVDAAKRVVGYARRHWYRESDLWMGPECLEVYGASHAFTVDYRNVKQEDQNL